MKGTKPNLKPDAKALTYRNPPSWLSKDAKAEWRRVMPVLAERRIMTEADLGGLESYCCAVGRVREMEREIQAGGTLLKIYRTDKDGNAILYGIRKNPAVSIQSDAMNKARLLAAEIGCTPVSRSRPTIEAPEDDDDLIGGDL